MKNPRTCSNTRTTLYTGCPREALLSLLKQALRLGREEREGLLFPGEKLTAYLQREETSLPGTPERKLVSRAAAQYAQSYAPKWGGFGQAPKFPTPHNLIFLMRHARLSGGSTAMEMAENILESMYRGGLFDHVGGGFSRYSTDRRWLVPHFIAHASRSFDLVFQVCGYAIYLSHRGSGPDQILIRAFFICSLLAA